MTPDSAERTPEDRRSMLVCVAVRFALAALDPRDGRPSPCGEALERRDDGLHCAVAYSKVGGWRYVFGSPPNLLSVIHGKGEPAWPLLDDETREAVSQAAIQWYSDRAPMIPACMLALEVAEG